MSTFKLLISLSIALLSFSMLFADPIPLSSPVLYNRTLQAGQDYPELIREQVKSNLTTNGLEIQAKDGLVRLNKYYSLAQRLIRYHIKLGKDAQAVFQSDKGDFIVTIDMAKQSLSLQTDPLNSKKVDFLSPEQEYILEIERNYQEASIRLISLNSGLETELKATNDGTGGVGAGKEGDGFLVGRQYDYYCFGLLQGSSLLIKQITVQALITNPILLIYGDSITEPEGYYPTRVFPESWTQLIINNIPGKAVSSGRGGTTINELLERIKNELPFIKAKYVMITIGTNGGNTEANLSQLVEYIQSQGSVPILNNIPSNESGSQVPVNEMIEKIRQKYQIKGCRFDVATSKNQDGKEVDQSTMYFEDYDWGKIYHHPNVKGSKLMYLRALLDIPEIFE